jgi:hypothetical protein
VVLDTGTLVSAALRIGSAEADAVVSSDEDLLVLHPWRGIAIVTPAEFSVGVQSFAGDKDRHMIRVLPAPVQNPRSSG